MIIDLVLIIMFAELVTVHVLCAMLASKYRKLNWKLTKHINNFENSQLMMPSCYRASYLKPVRSNQDHKTGSKQL